MQAIKQIEETEIRLQGAQFNGYTSFYRIVYRTGTHDVNSSAVMNWKKNSGAVKGRKRAIVKNIKLEENV